MDVVTDLGGTDIVSFTIDSQSTHFVRDAKSDGEKKQQSQRLDVFEKFMVPLLDENGEQRLDDEGLLLTVMVPHLDDLQGRTFLTSPDQGSRVKRARIVEALNKHEAERLKDPALVKFKIKFDRSDVEDIMIYNEILNHIERDNNDDDGTYWKYSRIVSHQHTPRGNKDRNGSEYNVEVEWEIGDVTMEPLDFIAEDVKLDLAVYAKENDLIDKPGWIRFRDLAKNEKKTLRLIKQARLRSFQTAPKYMYGFKIPKDYNEAVELDVRNGNTKWQDSTHLEMS